jgi:PAS domain S-box-containing protein
MSTRVFPFNQTTRASKGDVSKVGRKPFFTGDIVSEEVVRLVVETFLTAMVVTDAGGRIVLVNTEAERLFGYHREELVGKQIEMFAPPAMAASGDIYILRKDGAELPVEIQANPICTSKGKMVLSAVVDISERRRTEAALHRYAEREQLFVAVVESSDDAIVTKTLDGVITSWNQAAERLFGFSAQEAIGKSIDIIVPDEFRDEVRMILDRIGRDEKVDHHDTIRTSKDGRRIDVSLSVSPVKSPTGQIVGAAKVARDITVKKRDQQALATRSEELQRSNADLEQFAYVASHDLQEPLRMVSTYTQLLSEHYAGALDEKAQKYMNYSLDGSRRMLQLIKDLLIYAQELEREHEASPYSLESLRETVSSALKAAEQAFWIIEQPNATQSGESDTVEVIVLNNRAIDLNPALRPVQSMSSPNLQRLTPREREVLALVTEGVPNKVGAFRLSISVRTFEAHRANLMGKLDAKNAAELVHFGLRAAK